MTDEFEKAIKKCIYNKINCCEETLNITDIKPKENCYIVYYYIPSLDRNEQNKFITVLLTEVIMYLK